MWIKGYEYYDIPEELRYRYPSPGSVAMDHVSYPHLFKKHWKMPFRDSPYNIRRQEVKWTQETNTEHVISDLVDWSDHPLLAGMQKPETDDLEVRDNVPMDDPSKLESLWAEFENQKNVLRDDARDYSDYFGDYAHEYNPVQVQWRERGATGFLSDAKTRQIFADFEYWIEDVIGAKQIKEKKVHFYSGTPKKWQILEDDTYDREQVEKLQAAVQAPLPEELEMYVEKHSKPMQLPFNNANVTAWRDHHRRPNDSADFDPEFLAIDRDRRKKFFLERYEQPKQISQ